MSVHPADVSHTRWENSVGPNGGRLPCRSTTGRRSPGYVEPDEWNLLRHVTEMPYDVLLFEARQVLRMHEPVVHVDTTYDKHAMWRDLVKRDDRPGRVYERQRCAACADDGCALLDAAKLFDAIIGPYLLAERGREVPAMRNQPAEPEPEPDDGDTAI